MLATILNWAQYNDLISKAHILGSSEGVAQKVYTGIIQEDILGSLYRIHIWAVEFKSWSIPHPKKSILVQVQLMLWAYGKCIITCIFWSSKSPPLPIILLMSKKFVTLSNIAMKIGKKGKKNSILEEFCNQRVWRLRFEKQNMYLSLVCFNVVTIVFFFIAASFPAKISVVHILQYDLLLHC